MAVSDLALFAGKGRIWRSKQVSARELNVAISRWEGELRFLEEHTSYNMEDADMRFNILMIAPSDMRRKALEDYS